MAYRCYEPKKYRTLRNFESTIKEKTTDKKMISQHAAPPKQRKKVEGNTNNTAEKPN